MPNPVPQFTYDEDDFDSIAKHIGDTYDWDPEVVHMSLNTYLKDLATKVLTEMVQDNLVEQRQLEPNTLYKLDQTLHRSPDLVSAPGSRLIALLYTTPDC